MTYMFDNTLELEEERLRICNVVHNPKTLAFLKPYLDNLPNNAKILEVGCGTGLFAKEVYPLLPKDSQFYLLDRSEEQLVRSKELFADTDNINFLSLDLISQAKELQKQGPFDLIYCRWVVCHIPNPERINALKTLMATLNPKGILFIEDCDNTEVAYRTQGGETIPAYAKKAEELFHETSKQICDFAQINLQLSGEKLLQCLQEATGVDGRCFYIGSYQAMLNTKEEKRLLSLAWKTAFGLVAKAKGLAAATEADAKALVGPAEQCDEDDNVYGVFLTESICVFEKY